jgi:chaperone BCS1
MSQANTQSQHPNQVVYRQPNCLEKCFNVDLEATMQTGAFQSVKKWLKDHTGLELPHLVDAITLLIPVTKYGRESVTWLHHNATSALSIDRRSNIALDLQAWINNQPVSSLLGWLPSFDNLVMKQPASDNLGDKERAGSVYNTMKASRHQFFFYQGVPFILSTAEDRYASLTLRCLWPNAKPINDLLCHISETSEKRDEPLNITYVRAGGREGDSVTKRSLSTIDMEPAAKQKLLTDVQTFFDQDTKAWYRSNGIPYRRGYLLYGPPGTGKTSLSQAIAGEYDLELFVIDLTGMDDTTLQLVFKELPERCVVLIEDIDAAGIVRENLLKKKEKETKDPSPQVIQELKDYDWGRNACEPNWCNDENSDASGISYGAKNKVTLSDLLNTLDGPGAKEGRMVIMTTNAPDALDPAIHRKGRMDQKIYLGYSTPMSAACAFTRLFGNDPKQSLVPEILQRLAHRFGKKVPQDMFTPCEIQEFCMERRGQPLKAIKDLPGFIEERITGKHDFEYDITRKPVAHDMTALKIDEETDSDDELLAELEASQDRANKPVLATPSTDESTSDDHTPSRTSSSDSLYARFLDATSESQPVRKSYFPAQISALGQPVQKLTTLFKGLFKSSAQERSLQDILDNVSSNKASTPIPASHLPLLQDDLPFDRAQTTVHGHQPSLSVAQSNPLDQTRTQEANLDFHPASTPQGRTSRLRSHSLPLPATDPDTLSSLAEKHGVSNLSAVHDQVHEELQYDSESDLSLTPCSTTSGKADTYHQYRRYRRTSHPDVIGRRNLHPFEGPIDEGEEMSSLEHTVVLRSVSPKPMDDVEVLHVFG